MSHEDRMEPLAAATGLQSTPLSPTSRSWTTALGLSWRDIHPYAPARRPALSVRARLRLRVSAWRSTDREGADLRAIRRGRCLVLGASS